MPNRRASRARRQQRPSGVLVGRRTAFRRGGPATAMIGESGSSQRRIRDSSFQISALLGGRYGSIDKDKFTAVEKHATGVGEAVFPRVGAQEVRFPRQRLARQGQAVGPLDLLRQLRTFTLQTRGEMFALPDNKRIVQRGQRLQGGDRGVA